MGSKLDNVYNTITQRNLFVSKQNIPILKVLVAMCPPFSNPHMGSQDLRKIHGYPCQVRAYNATIYSSIKASKKYV